MAEEYKGFKEIKRLSPQNSQGRGENNGARSSQTGARYEEL
jgi:hypothetical protein